MTEENLNAMQSCETQFIDKNYPIMLSGPEGCCFNEQNQTQDKINKKHCIVHMFSHVYAQLFVTIAVVAVITEIVHGPIPLYFIHTYVYLYLLSGSIIIFIWGFMNSIIHRFIRKKNPLDVLEYGLVPSWYFDLGFFVCGLAGFSCTCLKSAAALFSENCMSSAASSLFILNAIFIILQLHFYYSKVVSKLHKNIHYGVYRSTYTTFNMSALYGGAAYLIEFQPFIFVFRHCSICARAAYVPEITNLRYISSCFQNFSVMHLSATNAAFWLYMVLWESSTDWQDKWHLKHNSTLSWSKKDLNISIHTAESDINSSNESLHFPKHVVHFTSNCWWRIVPDSELSTDILSIQFCLQNSSIGMFWKKISEYLYPFAVQYYLIALFLLCINQQSIISKCMKLYSSKVCFEFDKKTRYCFCLSKGFYLGCVYFLVSLVIVVFYFIFNIENIDVVVMSMLCIIYASAIFAALIGLYQMKSVTTEIESPYSVYQEIGIYFIYAYATSNLFAASFSEEKYTNLLLIIDALLMILHAVSQYILIKSVSKSRQAVNFLILCNASLWLLESFVYCYKTSEDMQLKVYGVAWPIMNRIIIPCLAFYRFISILLLSNLSQYLSAEFC